MSGGARASPANPPSFDASGERRSAAASGGTIVDEAGPRHDSPLFRARPRAEPLLRDVRPHREVHPPARDERLRPQWRNRTMPHLRSNPPRGHDRARRLAALTRRSLANAGSRAFECGSALAPATPAPQSVASRCRLVTYVASPNASTLAPSL